MNGVDLHTGDYINAIVRHAIRRYTVCVNPAAPVPLSQLLGFGEDVLLMRGGPEVQAMSARLVDCIEGTVDPNRCWANIWCGFPWFPFCVDQVSLARVIGQASHTLLKRITVFRSL